jgi:hypothetical protein
VWSFIFGPLGILITLCLSNLAKQKQEAAQAVEQAKSRELLEAQVRMPQEQLQQLQALVQAVVPKAAAQPLPPSVTGARVADT